MRQPETCHCGRRLYPNTHCACISDEEISAHQRFLTAYCDGRAIEPPEHDCLGPTEIQ